MQLYIIEEDDELCKDVQFLESNSRLFSGWSIRISCGYLITHRFFPAVTSEDQVIPHFAALVCVISIICVWFQVETRVEVMNISDFTCGEFKLKNGVVLHDHLSKYDVMFSLISKAPASMIVGHDENVAVLYRPSDRPRFDVVNTSNLVLLRRIVMMDELLNAQFGLARYLVTATKSRTDNYMLVTR